MLFNFSNVKSTTRMTKQTNNANIVTPTKNARSSIAPPEETSRPSKKRLSDVAEIHQDTVSELTRSKGPTLVEPLQSKASKAPTPFAKRDSLQIFFESIVSTMRTFPPLSIAKIKLQISQLVGSEEIALAESNANAEVFYLTKNQIAYENEKECEIDYDSSNESVD